MKNEELLAPRPAGLSAHRRERAERLELANRAIRIIGSHGRRFLSLSSDRRVPLDPSDERFSRFEFANARLWYVDKWRESRIFVHYDPVVRSGWGWRFSDGGTLLSLCRALRDFILHGDRSVLRHFGPFPQWSCGGDLWGYGEEMATVRERVWALFGEPEKDEAHAPDGAGASNASGEAGSEANGGGEE